MWEEQERGTFLAAETERSLAWAAGVGHADALAFVGFAAWAQSFGLDARWRPDDPSRLSIGSFNFHILADRSKVFDCFEVDACGEEWGAVVRVMDAQTPLIHILGMSGRLNQIQREPGPWPVTRLVRPTELLRVFLPIETEAKHA